MDDKIVKKVDDLVDDLPDIEIAKMVLARLYNTIEKVEFKGADMLIGTNDCKMWLVQGISFKKKEDKNDA